MNLSGTDFNKLYRLQDKFLTWWHSRGYPFYLKGGTALGRFYLNHRFSEDLDFFLNGDTRYPKYIEEIKNKITSHFAVNINQSLFAEDYTRFFITEEGISLKVELINDVTYYAGKPAVYRYGNKWFQSFKVPMFQSSKVPKIQRFKDSKIDCYKSLNRWNIELLNY